MPYYSRYRRRSGYLRYRRRYGYRLRRRYARRSTTSGSVSSRSRVRVRVLVEQVVTLTVPAEQTKSNVASSVPYAVYASPQSPGSLVAGATGSPLYQQYTKLYDQVKCDGVISKIAVTTPVGSGTVSALQIVTAYDRNASLPEAAQLGYNDKGQLVAAPTTYDEVLESSGSVVRSAVNNSVAKLSRSCWASDLQERTTFHDCSLNNRNNDALYSGASWNVGFFSPMLLVGFNLPAAAPTEATSISFILSQTYYFTFRNPKFGAASGTASGGASGASTRAAAVDFDDPLAAQTLDAEDRVFVRDKSGYTPPKKQSRSVVGAMMEAGLDDPADVTPHLLESLAEREEAMEDPDYVGNPKGIMDHFDKEAERTDLQVNLRRGKRDADRWHARHDGETTLLSPPHDTPRVVPLRKK